MHAAAFTLSLCLLAGCAAVAPGYSPDEPAKLAPALQPFNGGSMSSSGRYIVSTEERALTCGKLTGSMQVIMSRLKDSANRPRAGAVASAMQTATQPFVSKGATKGADLDVDNEIVQARARLKAYNELLAEKKCKTLDIAGV